MALHLRGNTEAFMRAASKHKKLRMQAGTHVHPYYTAEGKEDQIRFFDYWLKGIDNGVMDEPPVKLAIRKGRDEVEWRFEHEWPLARTQWTKYYFDLSPQRAPRATRVVWSLRILQKQHRALTLRPALVRWALRQLHPRRSWAAASSRTWEYRS